MLVGNAGVTLLDVSEEEFEMDQGEEEVSQLVTVTLLNVLDFRRLMLAGTTFLNFKLLKVCKKKQNR